MLAVDVKIGAGDRVGLQQAVGVLAGKSCRGQIAAAARIVGPLPDAAVDDEIEAP